MKKALVVFLFALVSMAPASAQTPAGKNWDEKQIFNNIFVEGSGGFGLNLFAGILGLATPAGANYDTKAILNRCLYVDDTGKYGLSVYLSDGGGGGVTNLQEAYDGGSQISTSLLNGAVKIRDGGDGGNLLEFRSQTNDLLGFVDNAGAGQLMSLTVTDMLLESGAVSVRTTTQTVTNSTAMTNDNTLEVEVEAGKAYLVTLTYYMTTDATSGAKTDLAGGTATVSAIQGRAFYGLYSPFSAMPELYQWTALEDDTCLFPSGDVAEMHVIEGVIVAATGGSLIPRFAQASETGDPEDVTAGIGSYLRVKPLN